MVTLLMTLFDFERSTSWPQHVWGSLSRKQPEIQTQLHVQWSTYKKWQSSYFSVCVYLFVCLCTRVFGGWKSRKRFKIEARLKWTTNRWSESNGYVIDDVIWLWKVNVVTPTCLGLIISKTAGDTDSVTCTMEHL